MSDDIEKEFFDEELNKKFMEALDSSPREVDMKLTSTFIELMKKRQEELAKIKSEVLHLFNGVDYLTSDEIAEQFREWKKARYQSYTGVNGGQFTYEFTPTSLGLIVVVKDHMGDEENNTFDLTEYRWW